MSNLHNTNMSLRLLHKILRARGLRRRGRSINMQDIMAEIMDEIRSNGSDKGYRAMHQALTRKGFAVDKDSVRLALKELDPEGVALRSRPKLRRRKYYAKGPNDFWHLDGNDKLKPYGFSIYGYIDGKCFSRKMLWLNLSPSNKNPSEIAYYYINTVLKVGGVSRRMRADRGVENATAAGIRRFLRRSKSHQNCSFLFGKSFANQRIEAWWSYLRKVFLQRWINYFKDLIDEVLFDPSDEVDQECIRFSFYGILQDELDEIMKAWNQHRIRRTRTSEGNNGVPDVMYFLPNRYGKENRRNEIEGAGLLLSREFINEPPYYERSNEFGECIIINELQIDMPKDKKSAEQLYF